LGGALCGIVKEQPRRCRARVPEGVQMLASPRPPWRFGSLRPAASRHRRRLLVAGVGLATLSHAGCGETILRSYLLVTVQGAEPPAPGGEAATYQLAVQLGTTMREVPPSEARLSAESPPRFAIRLPDDAAGQAATVRVSAFLGDCPVQTASSATQTVTAGINQVTVKLPPRPAQPCTLTVTAKGPGRVVSEPPGISCPGTCSARFSPRQRITLTATPSGGSGALLRWDRPSACGATPACDLGELPPGGGAAEVTMAAGPPAINRCATTQLSRGPTLVTSTLNGVWVGEGGEAWAVGDGGVVLRRSLGAWSPAPLTDGPTAADTLTGVYGTGAPSTVFISGSGSTVWVRRDTGAVVSYRRSGGTSQLRAVFGSSRSETWGVGDGGEALRINDTQTSVIASSIGDGVTGRRSAVWTDSPDNVWLLGDSGQLTHRTPAGLVPRTTGSGARGLFGTRLGPLWIVGPGTGVWRVPASLVASDGYGATQDLRSAAGLPPGVLALNGVWSDGGNVWIVGDGGALYCKPSGSDTWQSIPGQTVSLRAVAGYVGAAESRLIIVGAQGLILESPL
jgi:hypothetical protein